ncbi:putative RING-H2 finger protein ATL21C [Zingiber officinale]|uniref:putative RING-H2 finger protein ATL21C n=1 Tax=Zingiber officinale TaxID=94328 RepID=UPI001C4BFE05|nr:putative RING-H2 finger protein ATL21C [Zingiber officinale]
MSISIEYCYSKLELVRCLKEAALFFALLLKWLLLPSHAWWLPSPSPSTYLEDTAAAAEARARYRAAAARAALRVTTYEDLVETAEEVRSAGVGVGVTCAVCLSEMAARDVVWELTNCRHVFHKGCLDRWLDHDEHLSCPLCRTALLPAQQSPPLPPAEPSWAVERLLYFFGDDHLLAPPP